MSKVIGEMILAAVLVLGLALAGCGSAPDSAPASIPQADSPALDFQLQSLEGQSVSLSSLRGRPVMLNFWATWCGPCQVEMPFIQGVFEDKKWTEQGLVILAVNVGEASSRVKEFMEANGLSFPVLLDTDANVAQDYNIRGIPTTFFIDKNGIIKDIKMGSFSNKAEIDWRLLNSIMENE